MTAYDGLILDHDGVVATLVDGDWRTDTFCALAESAFHDRGISTESLSLSRLAHSVTPETVREMSEGLDATAETLWQIRDDALAAVLQDATSDGVKRPYDDVDAIERVDMPLGVASNNQHRVVEFVLDEYDLRSQFDAVHAREPELASLPRKKPSPTFLEAAQEDIGVSNPLYVGDKETDVVAAQRAGMDAAFLRRDHNRDRLLDVEPAYDVSTLTAVATLFN
jgi:HAD superfamily hydrolase (TIGR01549 family)